MVPIVQTKFGLPGGNCMQACIASLLEIPLEEAPDVCNTTPEGESWLEALQEWLGPQGMGYAFQKMSKSIDIVIPGLCLLGVVHTGHRPEQTAAGMCHVVVGRCTPLPKQVRFDVVHDPLPEPSEITEILDILWIVKNGAKE